jgi:hypothetical protein
MYCRKIEGRVDYEKRKASQSSLVKMMIVLLGEQSDPKQLETAHHIVKVYPLGHSKR